MASGDGNAHLTVRTEARVEVVDVPELDDVVFEVQALRQDVVQILLVATIEERRPTGVGVRQRNDVVVDERVGDTLGDDVALVTIECKRRCIARVDPWNAGHVELLTHS